MVKLILILLFPLSCFAQAFTENDQAYMAWLGRQTPVAPQDFKSVLLADSPDHLYFYDDVLGQITDYIGGNNLSIPSGLTLGYPGLLVGNPLTCANANGSASISMGSSSINDYASNTNWTYEFLTLGTNALSGSASQYVYVSKSGASSFDGYILEQVYNNVVQTRDGTFTPSTWMMPRAYLQDSSLRAYDTSGTINLTNGGIYHVIFTYQYTNNTPIPRFWVNGSPVQMTYGFNGTLGDFGNHSLTANILSFNGSDNFRGDIGTTASYNYLLVEIQVLTHYLASQGLKLNFATTFYTHYRGLDDRGMPIQNNTACYFWCSASNLWYIYGMDTYGDNIKIGLDYDVTGRTNVSIYSSPTLAQNTWTFVTNAFLNALPNTFSVESPSVLHNAANNNYVMWTRRYDQGSPPSVSWYCVSTSASPIGPFIPITTNTIPPGASAAGDASLFEDTDGTGYVVFSDNSSISVIALGAAYTNTIGTATTVISGAGLEGCWLVKVGSSYLLGGSSAEYFNQLGMKQNVYAVSTAANPLSGWGTTNTIFQPGHEAYGTGFDFQSRHVFQSAKNPSRFFISGDLWINGFLANSVPTIFELMFPTPTTMCVSNLTKGVPLP